MPDESASLALTDSSVAVMATIGEDVESDITRDSLADAIRVDLNDKGYFYEAADINDSLQDAYDEIAAFTGCIEKAVAIDFISKQAYYDLAALIPDFIAVTGIYNRRVKRWMNDTSYRSLDQIRDDWELSNGEPYLYAPVNYRYVAIFPQVNTTQGQMYVFYKAQAPILVGDSTPLIPIEIQQEILTGYVDADLLEQAEEFGKAGRFFKGYQEKIAELIRFLKKRDAERLPQLGGFF